jgi:hypothetical protein
MPVDPSSVIAAVRRRAARAKDRVQAWSDTPAGRRTLKVLRHGLTVVVAAYLLYQMTQIGWARVWASLPTTPWFYVISVVLFFLLPVFRAVGFGLIWDRPAHRLLGPTTKSAVYNKEVMSYSGEMYLFSWAQANVGAPARRIAHHIKDNAIVSSVASTVNAVLLLAFFVLSGMVRLPLLTGRNGLYAAAAFIGAAVIVGAGIRFRKAVFKLSGRLILTLFGLYFARLLVLQALQVTQWAVAIPDVAVQTWLTFLAVQIIISRLPLLPSQDLLFMAVGLKMAGSVQVPEAALAGVLAVHSVLDKGMGLVLFGVISFFDRGAVSPGDVGDATGDGDAAPPPPDADRRNGSDGEASDAEASDAEASDAEASDAETARSQSGPAPRASSRESEAYDSVP